MHYASLTGEQNNNDIILEIHQLIPPQFLVQMS